MRKIVSIVEGRIAAEGSAGTEVCSGLRRQLGTVRRAVGKWSLGRYNYSAWWWVVNEVACERVDVVKPDSGCSSVYYIELR